MDKPSLLRLLPRNKDDAVGAIALTKLGYPTVEPVLDQMLDWLRTNGSPVDIVMRAVSGVSVTLFPAANNVTLTLWTPV